RPERAGDRGGGGQRPRGHRGGADARPDRPALPPLRRTADLRGPRLRVRHPLRDRRLPDHEPWALTGSGVRPGSVIRRVRGRAIVVLEERPYLWAALRERVPPATAYVLGAGPAEIGAVWDRCEPWPWLLAGTTAALPDG